MSVICEIRPGQTWGHAGFPDPRLDLEPGDGSPQAVVLAGGCFWCVEAVYKALDGVVDVTSGYAGGTPATANYTAVCGGDTDHAEVIRVRFEPKRISFGQVLKVFFSVAHDPTQLDGQGNDRGRQYRSAVFYANDVQNEVAGAYIKQLDEAGIFRAPIVTTLEPLTEFFEAERYHQNYAELHPEQAYIAGVAMPKVKKLKEYYAGQLKG